MSHVRYARHVLKTLLGICLISAVSCATSHTASGPVEVQDEPHHHVVFKNPVMRILEVNIPAGVATLYHHHRRDNVAVIQNGGELTNQKLGEPQPPARTLTPGMTVLTRAVGEGYIHRVANVGGAPIRVLDIEFLQEPGSFATTDNSPAQPSADNDRFRAYTLSLAPGATSQPLKLAPGVRVIIAGTRIEQIAEGGVAKRVDTSSRPWCWRDAGTYRLRNDSQAPALVVELEVK
jgi:hypothetical protein